MRIYNSATHKKEEFQPIESGKVRMYVCGPTVYDNIHIGNARTFISFDVIRRWLIASGYEVTFAQNLTDVDDKIIKRANEQGRTAAEVATEFSDKFIGVMRAANVLDPDVRPRATKEIGPMIAMIKTLIEQGHAYAADNGDVYFAVRSDPNYGQVSGRNIDDLMVGARIEENEDKNDPLDFALWKAAKPGEPSWPSPWGEGRPGWHTECAAMVHRYLGTPIDIHGGGSDLAFPHHENECAQATCAWHQGFSNTWMHTGMLLVDGEKMSKSRGNVVNPDDIVQDYGADTLRTYEMFIGAFDLSASWSEEGVKGCRRFLERVWKLQDILTDEEGYSADLETKMHQTIKKVSSDFENLKYNTAIAAMMSLINEFYKKNSITRGEYKTLLTLLNPVAPHITEELWQTAGFEGRLYQAAWPEYEEEKTVENVVEIGVQVNGKMRVTINVSKDETRENVIAMAKEALGDKLTGNIVKEIYVPGRIVNIVAK